MHLKVRYKYLLLAIIPLLISFAGIAAAVFYQAVNLAKLQRETVQQAYLSSKEAELKHYVYLAKNAILRLYNTDQDSPEVRESAKNILASLDFGDDGYFYLYDMQGTNLMHPRQPELVGQNLWEMRDSDGNPTIQNLISKAKSGGGVVRYMWRKPSTRQMAPKLGYVIYLERWGWMLGTGIYLDDVDNALNKIDTQVTTNIHSTLFWITTIALICVLLIAVSGLVLNISESRIADAKLKILARSVVRSQEEERARLSRDLHDGISQLLVSSRLQVESGIARVKAGGPLAQDALVPLERATKQLNDTLSEVRRISHDLRPAMLDDLGLVPAFEHLAGEFEGASSLPVHFYARGNFQSLTAVSNTVLFRVAQEALTNIHKHAQNVSEVEMSLLHLGNQVTLTIRDNGSGFDLAGIYNHPKRGIGLSNMRERLASVSGQLELLSTEAGTTVIARIPSGEL